MADSTCILTRGWGGGGGGGGVVLSVEISHLTKAKPIQLFQVLNKGKTLKNSKHVLFIILLKFGAKFDSESVLKTGKNNSLFTIFTQFCTKSQQRFYSGSTFIFEDYTKNGNYPQMSLNPTVVYSTDRSKAEVPVLVLLFVALWFILRGNLFYVLHCVILVLCFSVLLAYDYLAWGRES